MAVADIEHAGLEGLDLGIKRAQCHWLIVSVRALASSVGFVVGMLEGDDLLPAGRSNPDPAWTGWSKIVSTQGSRPA